MILYGGILYGGVVMKRGVSLYEDFYKVGVYMVCARGGGDGCEMRLEIRRGFVWRVRVGTSVREKFLRKMIKLRKN